MPLQTTLVKSSEEIRAFFDAIAPNYADSHGPAAPSLRYRLSLIESLLSGTERNTLVEIGCGTGLHLFPLSEKYQHTIGTDLSSAMIARAEKIRQQHPHGMRVQLCVDPAETLGTVADETADAVLCVGALEHIPEKGKVLSQVFRILRPGGTFVCLTPNGEYVWYRHLAPRLGLATRHLSTDRFLGKTELTALLNDSGMSIDHLLPWTFIPRGDMPKRWASLLQLIDGLGRMTGITCLRGGIAFRAIKPRASAPPGRSGE